MTGVQTCALPIYMGPDRSEGHDRDSDYSHGTYWNRYYDSSLARHIEYYREMGALEHVAWPKEHSTLMDLLHERGYNVSDWSDPGSPRDANVRQIARDYPESLFPVLNEMSYIDQITSNTGYSSLRDTTHNIREYMLTLAGGPLYNQLVLQHFLTFKHAQKMAQQIASNSRFTDRDLLQLPYLYNQYLASDTNDVSYSAAIRPLLPNIYEAMEREGAQLKQAFEATRLMSQEKYSDGSFLDSEDHTYAERVLQLVRDIPEYLSLTRHLLQLQKQFPESPVPRSLQIGRAHV